MKHQPISRRTILKQTAAVGIGLPLLEEMLANDAVAGAERGVPVRAFNVFFGLGIPAPLQAEGFNGVLQPLEPLGKKLLIMRNISQVRCDENGINAHFDGASGAFTAEPPDGEAKSGGPSIDQVIRRRHYPNGMPAGMVPTLNAGTFFRRSRISRYVHSYGHDGTVAASMQETPRDLFDRIFGAIEVVGDGENARRRRLKRSVLDSVVNQYKYFTGPNSPLGATSRARVAEHLDRIREYEQRAFALKQKGRPAADLPPRKLGGGLPSLLPSGTGSDIGLGATDDHVEALRLDHHPCARRRKAQQHLAEADDRPRHRASHPPSTASTWPWT